LAQTGRPPGPAPKKNGDQPRRPRPGGPFCPKKNSYQASWKTQEWRNLFSLKYVPNSNPYPRPNGQEFCWVNSPKVIKILPRLTPKILIRRSVLRNALGNFPCQVPNTW